jgi:hypothetical protein
LFRRRLSEYYSNSSAKSHLVLGTKDVLKFQFFSTNGKNSTFCGLHSLSKLKP